jgi:hypothetical protein
MTKTELEQQAFSAGATVRNAIGTGVTTTKDAAKTTTNVATSFLRGLFNKPAKAAQ